MAITRIKGNQIEASTAPGALLVSDTSNNFTVKNPTTGADTIWFYDDSATTTTQLTLGTNLSITGTTLNASAGAGGYSEIQEEGTPLTVRTKFNFVGAGITAADDAPNTRTNITLDATLNALAVYNTNGLLTQTAADTFTGRTLTGTTNRITVTNGDGVSGNPTIDIHTSYVGQASITTLGTISTGTWNGSVIAAIYGGTGISSYAIGDILYANTTTSLARLADVAVGSVLKSGGIGVAPSWGTLASTDLTNSSNIALLNGTQTFTGTNTFNNNITMNGTPSANTDVVTVGYVNNLLQGLDPKQSVRVATTTAGTLATSFANGQVVDGVTLVTGDRILVKDQAAPAENGIRIVAASGAPARATDMDSWIEVPGAFTFVEEGTVNADTGWVCSSNSGGTLNTTPITFVKFANAGTGVTSVAATAPAAGFTISGSPITSTGTFVFTLADDLAAVEALSTNGIVVRTASNTWITRTDTGTTNRITVTNGDGIAGNPTFDIASTYVGQASITTLGTITSGTWNGTTIGVANGGTGLTATTIGGILVGSSTSAFTNLTIGTNGYVLTSNGTTATWAAPVGGTITRAYLTGSTSSVIDLDSGTAVTDIDGTNITFTVPSDLDKVFVVRNGMLLSRSGTVSRDYTLVSATGVLTLASALTSGESLMVYKIV